MSEALNPLTLTEDAIESTRRTIPRVGATIFKEDYVAPVTQDGLMKYRELAGNLFKKWVEVTRQSSPNDFFPNRDEEAIADAAEVIDWLQTKEVSIARGFAVIGQVMGMTIAAYKNYRSCSTDRSVEELAGMQRHSETLKSSVLWLAERPKAACNSIEEALAIVDSCYERALDYGDISFIVSGGSTENPFFIPDPDRLDQLLPQSVLEAEGSKCLAIHFIPKLWGEMVSIAAADTRFYATDLGTTQ
jgi:hypothetical protein